MNVNDGNEHANFEGHAALPDLTEDAKTRKIIEDIFAEMEAEKNEKGSYFALVPEYARPVVAKLVTDNYPTNEMQFNGDLNAFAERMAQNWVAKRRAFPRLANALGYISLSHLKDVPPQMLKSSIVAALTINSSYVFVGPRAIESDGTGAAMDYKRLPLRLSTRLSDLAFEHGVRFKETPAAGKPMTFTGACSLGTSAIIELWIKPVDIFNAEERTSFHKTLALGNEDINRLTFL